VRIAHHRIALAGLALGELRELGARIGELGLGGLLGGAQETPQWS